MPSRAATAKQGGQSANLQHGAGIPLRANKKAGGAINPNRPSRAYRNLAKHALHDFRRSIMTDSMSVYCHSYRGATVS